MLNERETATLNSFPPFNAEESSFKSHSGELFPFHPYMIEKIWLTEPEREGEAPMWRIAHLTGNELEHPALMIRLVNMNMPSTLNARTDDESVSYDDHVYDEITQKLNVIGTERNTIPAIFASRLGSTQIVNGRETDVNAVVQVVHEDVTSKIDTRLKHVHSSFFGTG